MEIDLEVTEVFDCVDFFYLGSTRWEVCGKGEWSMLPIDGKSYEVFLAEGDYWMC